MKLIINRSQAEKKGFLGASQGIHFTLRYRLELTQEEMGLVDKYGLRYYPLTWTTEPGGRRSTDDTIASMLEGGEETLSDVTTLIKNEDTIKQACDVLPPLLDMARSFGGDEVIEYPRAGV